MGWGLLAGSAAVGAGAALYKKYRKHKLGKRLRYGGDADLQAAGIHHEKADLKKTLKGQSRLKRWNLLNTKSSRTYDLVRGQIGHKIAHSDDPFEGPENEHTRKGYDEIAGLVGIKKRKRRSSDDTANLLGNDKLSKERRRRARAIGEALEG